MDSDRIAGTARQAGGKLEEGFGKIIGDSETQLAGKANQAFGAAQDVYGQAKDAAAGAADVIRDGAVATEDYVRRLVEERPYTVAFAALALGFLLGRSSKNNY